MAPNMELLKRNYLPETLAPILKAAHIDGTISVQARQSLEESLWLLDLADRNSFIKGVVGWVDLRNERVGEQLERFVDHPKFRGVRHVVHDEPDDQFMLLPDFCRGIGRLRSLNLTYDLLLFPKHLPVACELIKLFPNQPFVIDHISKPPIREQFFEPWASNIRGIAAFENVYCKVSGMVTEADWNRWEPGDFIPYLDLIFECFGTKRTMVGSDWPVCTLAGTYENVMQIPAEYLQRFSQDEQEDVWYKNAVRFYGLETATD